MSGDPCLLVYTVVPGSDSNEQLQLLSVIGTQTLQWDVTRGCGAKPRRLLRGPSYFGFRSRAVFAMSRVLSSTFEWRLS